MRFLGPWKLVASLACLVVACAGVRAEERQVVVGLKKGVSLERVADRLAGKVKFKGKIRGTGLYVGLLKEGVALKSVQTLPGVETAGLISEKEAMMVSAEGTRKELQDLVREQGLEEDEDEEGKDGGLKKEVDAFGARQYYIQRRAFPNDTIDYSAYPRAIEHAKQMLRSDSPSARSSIQSTNWTFMGPQNFGTLFGTAPVSGRVNGVAYDPTNTNIIYVASAGGGAWKSIDGGVTFSSLSDNWPTLNTSCVAVSPANHNVVYVGTGDFDGWEGYSNGIMKSTDGGATWTTLGLADGFGNYAISKILIDPTNSNNILVAMGRGSAYLGFVYRSTDGGATWTKVITQAAPWSDIAVSLPTAVGSIRYMYAVSTQGHCYRSTDLGATWTAITTPLISGSTGINRVAVSPSTAQYVYLLDSNAGKIFKSVNHGDSFTDISVNFPANAGGQGNWDQSWYDSRIAAAPGPSGDILYVGLIDMVQSKDGGATWRTVAGVNSVSYRMHADQHIIAVNPANGNQALIGGDGGLFLYTFDPNADTWTFTSRNATLGITQFYHMAIHGTDPNITLAGAQDNSTSYSDGVGGWLAKVGGDGAYSAINPSDGNNMYGSSQFLRVVRTDDKWATSTTIHSPSVSAPFIAPFIMDPNDPNLIYMGDTGLIRYNRGTGATDPQVGGITLSNAGVGAIAVAQGSGARIYVGTADGLLWMSNNQGASWTQIQSGSSFLPARYISSISVNPQNPSDVLVGVTGTGSGHLFRCTDTMAATRVWNNVSGSGATGLPDISLNGIARDPYFPLTTWHVATDVGVFTTTDSGATWTNSTNPKGLPNVICNAIVSRPSDGSIYVATYGRGIWRMTATAPGTLKSVSVSPANVAGGTSSTGTVTLFSAAPAGGITVALSSNDASATVPASVTVPQNATTANFTITTANATMANKTATITATYTTEVKTTTLTVNPPNGSQYVTQTVPTSMISGQTYTVRVQFKNTGTTTWTPGTFALRSVGPVDNTFFAYNRLPLITASVPPGATGVFGRDVLGSGSAGVKNFQWQCYQEGVALFGPTSPATAVTVTKVADAARFLKNTIPSVVNAGQDFTADVRFFNVGTATWTSAAGYKLVSRNPYNNTNWGTNSVALPASTAPNTGAIFAGTFTAPTTPGTYQWQWSMIHGGSLFGDLPVTATINVVGGADNAKPAATGNVVPTSVGPGTTFNATVVMQNLGTATWDSASGYALKSVGGNFGVASIPVSGSVAPSGNATFSTTFTAPAAGTYHFTYRMAKGGVAFGAPFDVTVVVSADAAVYVSRTGLLTVNAGQDFYVQNTMKNTGTTSWLNSTGYWMMSLNPNNNTTWGKSKMILPGTTAIAPGTQVTLTGLMTAPLTPGSYTMQWQMNKSGVPFGEKSPLLNITVVQGPDNAQFVSQTTVPTTVAHDAFFDVSVVMKNTGTATWDGSYQLQSIGSNNFGVPWHTSVTQAPNTNETFTSTFRAPSTPGTYTFQMRMKHNTTLFGQSTTLVTITVT